MNITAATAFITANKGNAIVVQTADGNHFGTALSVNSKGVNIKVDGKTRSFALSRVTDLFLDNAGDDTTSDVPEDVAALLHDGMTTRELADILGTTPKELRVTLRAMGMGVGKGRKYSLTPSAYTAVKAALAAN